MSCGDETCQRMVQSHEETLHGEQSLVEKVGKKVSRSSLGWAVVTVGVPVAAGLLYMYAAVSGIHDVYASKEKVAEIEKEVCINAERYAHLKELLEEVKDLIKEVQREIKEGN